MRSRHTPPLYLVMAALMLIVLATASCATSVPPLGRAKQAIYALDVVYDRIQLTVVQAYSQKQITDAQWAEFKALDTKVITSGRLARDAIRAWQAGVTPTPDRMSKLSTDLVGLVSQAFDLAGKLGVKLPFTQEVLQQ